MLDKLFNLKGLGASVGLGILIGSLGAYKLAGAAQAKKDKKIAEAALVDERKAHQETMFLADSKDELVKVLSNRTLQDKEYISGLHDANLQLAARLPRDTVRYIERGQEIADDLVLQGGNECLNYIVPDILRQYANGKDIDASVSLPSGF